MALSISWIIQQTECLTELRNSDKRVCWIQKKQIGQQYHNQLYCYFLGEITIISDQTHSVKSHIHTYGGGSFWLNNEYLWYSNELDGQLYCYDFSYQQLKQITMPEQTDHWVFADGYMTQSGDSICVAERHQSGTVKYALVWIHSANGLVEVIDDQDDFYAYPRLNQDETAICWISWQKGHMPWQENKLNVANFNQQQIHSKEQLSGSNRSYSQPIWHQDSLIYLHDGTGFSNPYRRQDQQEIPLHPCPIDMGEPLWQLGVSTLCLLDESTLAIRCQHQAHHAINLIDLNTNHVRSEVIENTEFKPYLAGYDQQLFCLVNEPTTLTGLSLINLTTQTTHYLVSPPTCDYQEWSLPKPLQIDTLRGVIYAFLYLPAVINHQPLPLIVNCHSGPTASLSNALKPLTQYWCHHGYAVLDVAYSGTVGYGKSYQQRLDGHYGLMDSQDCIEATQYVLDHYPIHPNCVAIRGKSSGGFTALNGMIQSNLFSAGIIYYGITNLVGLDQTTHAFESGYLSTLVKPADQYSRSPINHIDSIQAPLLLLYGDQDPVVPLAQAESMIARLTKINHPISSKCYHGEGHGFSKPEHQEHAMSLEHSFLEKQFKLPS
ncbi:MAG: hypothetical protein CMF46_05355 [Legionellales bacterium]|nr:hypothetical protein [Legionellales bacterium]|tara:strand:+ start:975 stop:2786 length:1812 start_codon:yes stop_codon:yes gene_type:complete